MAEYGGRPAKSLFAGFSFQVPLKFGFSCAKAADMQMNRVRVDASERVTLRILMLESFQMLYTRVRRLLYKPYYWVNTTLIGCLTLRISGAATLYSNYDNKLASWPPLHALVRWRLIQMPCKAISPSLWASPLQASLNSARIISKPYHITMIAYFYLKFIPIL